MDQPGKDRPVGRYQGDPGNRGQPIVDIPGKFMVSYDFERQGEPPNPVMPGAFDLIPKLREGGRPFPPISWKEGPDQPGYPYDDPGPAMG